MEAESFPLLRYPIQKVLVISQTFLGSWSYAFKIQSHKLDPARSHWVKYITSPRFQGAFFVFKVGILRLQNNYDAQSQLE